MESYREIEKSLLGRKITARLQFLDEGLNVLLTGGEKSHIGAVSGRVPGQEPVDIEFPGHREGIRQVLEVCREMLEEILAWRLENH